MALLSVALTCTYLAFDDLPAACLAAGILFSIPFDNRAGAVLPLEWQGSVLINSTGWQLLLVLVTANMTLRMAPAGYYQETLYAFNETFSLFWDEEGDPNWPFTLTRPDEFIDDWATALGDAPLPDHDLVEVPLAWFDDWTDLVTEALETASLEWSVASILGPGDHEKYTSQAAIFMFGDSPQYSNLIPTVPNSTLIMLILVRAFYSVKVFETYVLTNFRRETCPAYRR